MGVQSEMLNRPQIVTLIFMVKRLMVLYNIIFCPIHWDNLMNFYRERTLDESELLFLAVNIWVFERMPTFEYP